MLFLSFLNCSGFPFHALYCLPLSKESTFSLHSLFTMPLNDFLQKFSELRSLFLHSFPSSLHSFFPMHLSESLQNFYESLLLCCSECRIWNLWSKPELNLEEFNYEVIGPVRNCPFNNVYRCYQPDTNQVVTIREIAITDKNEAVRRSINKRISSLRELRHENVVRLLDTFRRENYVYLVYEYFSPDLCYIISQPKNLRDPQLRNLLYQILTAVAYYQSRGIIHGDLKPQNLLINFRDRLLKLADFSLASAFGDPVTSYTIATSQYSAPELLLGSLKCSTAADIWSVGCIFGEMVTGRALFHGKSKRGQLKTIFGLLGTPTEDSWPGVTAICSSLSSFPKFETMNLAVKFPDLEPEALDLLSKMLCLDPSKRIAAKDALNHAYFNNSKSKPLSKKGTVQEIGSSSQQVQSSTLFGSSIQGRQG